MKKMDLLSDLPDEIIHNIMSFLIIKDSIKFISLSKQLRLVFYSFPDIVYDEEEFTNLELYFEVDDIIDSLNKLILHRRLVNPNPIDLDKFVFQTSEVNELYDEGVESRDIINSAIVFAAQSNVKEFHFRFTEDVYLLPIDIFTSKSIRVLNLQCSEIRSMILNSMPKLEILSIIKCSLPAEFKIWGCNINNLELRDNDGCKIIDIKAPHLELLSYTDHNNTYINFTGCKCLRDLRLDSNIVSDEWLASHLVAFPFLEVLNLLRCRSLKNIYINSKTSLKLKTIDLYSLNLENINICTPNLESFSYMAFSKDSCGIDIRACKRLKVLELYDVTIRDTSWSEDFVGQFPSLEELTLNECVFTEKTIIHGSGLKYLRLFYCILLKEIHVHAPNLTLFIYRGEPPFPVMSIDSSLLRVQLTLLKERGCIPKYDYFDKMCKFLVFFHRCKFVEMVCYGDTLFVPEEFRDNLSPPLIGVRHLKLERLRLSNLEKTLENFLWLSPRLDTLSFCDSFSFCDLDKKKMLRFQYTLVAKDDHRLDYWKHCLCEVSMVNFNDEEKNVLSGFFKRHATSLISISYCGAR